MWQWTQNVTGLIEVLFDCIPIPEFSDVVPPILGFVVLFEVYRQMARRKDRVS